MKYVVDIMIYTPHKPKTGWLWIPRDKTWWIPYFGAYFWPRIWEGSWRDWTKGI